MATAFGVGAHAAASSNDSAGAPARAGDVAAAPALTPSFIAAQFLSFYFAKMAKSPETLISFYQEDSSFARVSENQDTVDPVTGLEGIRQRIEELKYRNCRTVVDHVMAQFSLEGAVLVLLTGVMSNGGHRPHKFTQTFLLAQSEDRSHYYVRNDILRFTGVVKSVTSNVKVAAQQDEALASPKTSPVAAPIATPAPPAAASTADRPVASMAGTEAVQIIEDTEEDQKQVMEPEVSEVPPPAVGQPGGPGDAATLVSSSPADAQSSPPVVAVQEPAASNKPMPPVSDPCSSPEPVESVVKVEAIVDSAQKAPPSSWASLFQTGPGSVPVPIPRSKPVVKVAAKTPAADSSDTGGGHANGTNPGSRRPIGPRSGRMRTELIEPEHAVYIPNMAPQADEAAVKKIFSQFGGVQNVNIYGHKRNLCAIHFASGSGDNPRDAVEKCLVAAESKAGIVVRDTRLNVERYRRASHNGPKRRGFPRRGGGAGSGRGGMKRGGRGGSAARSREQERDLANGFQTVTNKRNPRGGDKGHP